MGPKGVTEGGEDSRFVGSRRRLIEEIRSNGITDLEILQFFDRVPRHKFLPEGVWNRAYEDGPVPIGYGQTASQPSLQAFYLSVLKPCSDESVLEIGTASGIVSLCCSQAGAGKVVATDINPWAVRNAAYNPELLNFGDRMEVRLVSQKQPQAWAVILREERFDVIISNPPWEPGNTTRVEDFAFYFRLIKSIVSGLPEHLNPGGQAFLAYGHVPAIRRLRTLLQKNNFPFRTRDERLLDELPDSFLPGMLTEVRLHDTFASP